MSIKNFTLIEFEDIDSTNLYLKKMRAELPSFTVVSALYQSHGRGRLGRSFLSLKGKNLLFSILLKDDFALQQHELLSLFVGYVLAKTLEKYHIESSIKWPNDVLINGKKTAGILLEGTVSEGKLDSVILGIGVNINQEEFDSSFNATSFKKETGKEFDVDLVKNDFLEIFFDEYQKWIDNGPKFLDFLREHNFYFNQEVNANYKGEECSIKVLDILDNGHLEFILNGKKQESASLELTFHKNI